MADIAAIRAGIKTRLATSSTFIQISATMPDQVSPPCAVIDLQSVSYDQAFANGLEALTFTITVIAQRFERPGVRQRPRGPDVHDHGYRAAVRFGRQPGAPR